MVAAIESAASRAPTSKWTEQALFLGGNFYWAQLNRDTASGFYKRVEENFPTSVDAISAALARGLDGGTQAPGKFRRSAHRTSEPVPGIAIYARRSVLARPPRGRGEQPGFGAVLLR